MVDGIGRLRSRDCCLWKPILNGGDLRLRLLSDKRSVRCTIVELLLLLLGRCVAGAHGSVLRYRIAVLIEIWKGLN